MQALLESLRACLDEVDEVRRVTVPPLMQPMGQQFTADEVWGLL